MLESNGCTLEDQIKKEKDPKVRDRLRIINLHKKGYKDTEISIIMDVSIKTVYNWRMRFKKEDYEGLKTKEKPGRKRKLTEEEIEKLIETLHQKDYWTTKGVRYLIDTEFKVSYTLRHVSRILRKIGMNYQKPFENIIENQKMQKKY
jgi:transposase